MTKVTPMVWYSSKARCQYWTDDWSTLGSVGPGIPCCPHCKAVGYQMPKTQWDAEVEHHAKSTQGYKELVAQQRNQCNTTLHTTGKRR